jgi:hypothetical protein
VVVAIIAVLSIYLIISAQAASAGLEIMDMHYEQEEIMRIIANERTELAWKTSYSEMQQRAEKSGYAATASENVHFMVIPVTRAKSSAHGTSSRNRKTHSVQSSTNIISNPCGIGSIALSYPRRRRPSVRQDNEKAYFFPPDSGWRHADRIQPADHPANAAYPKQHQTPGTEPVGG